MICSKRDVAKWLPHAAIKYYVIFHKCIIIYKHGPSYPPSFIALLLAVLELYSTDFCCKNNNKNKNKKKNKKTN